MGYREVQHDAGPLWCKPVGYHFLTFNERRAEWRNWFMGANGEVLVWETHHLRGNTPLEEVNFVRTLQEWEQWTRLDVYSDGRGGDFTLPVWDMGDGQVVLLRA